MGARAERSRGSWCALRASRARTTIRAARATYCARHAGRVARKPIWPSLITKPCDSTLASSTTIRPYASHSSYHSSQFG